jgi:hypothetical protein
MQNNKIQHLTDAFNDEDYEIDQIVIHEEKIGIAAKHRTATINDDPEKKKKVYYLEGSHKQMGHLLGRLAEDEIARMTTSFINNVIWAFIDYHPGLKINVDYEPDKGKKTMWNIIKEHIGDTVAGLISQFSQGMLTDIPKEYIEEMEGILEGCKETNSNTRVNRDDLWALNFGIDWLLAHVYTRFREVKTITRVLGKKFIKEIKFPIMCNGFSVFKDAAGGNHFFGRDFMFPTAGVFEDTACMIIYNPESIENVKLLPLVSMTAPGILGCISGMNIKGVGVGIDMSPSAACNPNEPGFNSLLLARHSIEKGGSAKSAKDIMAKEKRGVSWIYILSDGTNDKACVVESVYSTEKIPFTDFPPKKFMKRCLFRKALLPNKKFLEKHKTADQENGIMVRWEDYQYDEAYLKYNEESFKHFRKKLYPDALDKTGFINKDFKEKNCPHTYFFPPERETRKDVIIATNHFVIPEMRYTVMDRLLSIVINDVTNDTQWRYDTINALILKAIGESKKAGKRGIDYDSTKDIVNFLSPSGQYPNYYGKNKKVIEGSLSLFDLKKKTVESHYGYYKDKWIKLTLTKYVT